METVAVEPVLPAGLPAEWQQSADVRCPSCRYNLRMLRMPRCPECGLVFRWQSLLGVACPRCAEPLGAVDGDRCPRCGLPLDWPRLFDEGSLLNRSLFEYSDRPVRAALRTWCTALNPWRFWAHIPLEAPPAVARLRRLRNAAFGVCCLGLLLIKALEVPLSRWAVRPSFLGGRFFLSFLLVFTLPVLTMLALPRFTPTLVRFRVRREQLLRCLGYSTSGLAWIGLACLASFLVAVVFNVLWPLAYRFSAPVRLWFDPVDFFDPRSYFAWRHLSDWQFIAFNMTLLAVLLFFSLLWWWAFLLCALRRYLRLDRLNAWALFFSTQILGVMMLLILLLQIDGAKYACGHLIWWLERVFLG